MPLKLIFLQSVEINTKSISINNIQDCPSLLNGVALGENTILLATGGWNAVLSINTSGKIHTFYGGKKGVGRNHLKEPVVIFVSPDNLIYVADWHNHRIVILDNNLEYLDEFGYLLHLSERSDPIKKIFRYLRS